MSKRTALLATGLAVVVASAVSIGYRADTASAKQRVRAPISLDAKHAALKAQFNRDAKYARLVVLVSPT